MAEISHRMIDTNGIKMRLAESGSGPVVLLIHGWPESWYSWRHQLTALADAGYHAVAPDMRGYGDTDAPASDEEYRIDILANDVVGILDAIGEQKATLVGHDWGAMVVWHAALAHADRFNGVVGMSVPYRKPAPTSPLEMMKKANGDNFFYILYHNEEGGVAEAEYDSNPKGLLEMLYSSLDVQRGEPTIIDPKRSAGGWLGRLGVPKELPHWLTHHDLDYYVNEFTRAGFRGGVNYYRNFERNWEYTKDMDPVITIPSAFIAGASDMVIGGADKAGLVEAMSPVLADMREVTVIPGMGHWGQQEAPEETNKAILAFLKGI